MKEITPQAQRKSHRIPVRLPFSFAVVSDREVAIIRGESIDLSKTGMRVRTAAPLASGQILEVTLLEGTPNPVAARVVWAGNPSSPDEYEFGLEYVNGSAGPA